MRCTQAYFDRLSLSADYKKMLVDTGVVIIEEETGL